MPVLRRLDLLRQTVLILGGKVGIWKQERESVNMSEPISTGALPCLPTNLLNAIFRLG
jgi:hypothetical protein